MAEVSSSPSKTLITPSSWATNTRPSGENATDAGAIRSSNAVSSMKSSGTSATGEGAAAERVVVDHRRVRR